MTKTKPKRYILVGGNPLRCYTGTTTYTGLRIVGRANTAKQAAALTKKLYDECGGLFLWIDSQTGEEGEPK